MINAKNNGGGTALMIAINGGHEDVAVAILNEPDKVNKIITWINRHS